MAGQLALIEGVPAASETEGQDVEFKLLLAVGLASWTYIVFTLGACAGRCSKYSKPESQARRTHASPVRELQGTLRRCAIAASGTNRQMTSDVVVQRNLAPTRGFAEDRGARHNITISGTLTPGLAAQGWHFMNMPPQLMRLQVGLSVVGSSGQWAVPSCSRLM